MPLGFCAFFTILSPRCGIEADDKLRDEDGPSELGLVAAAKEERAEHV
jgi:hypothetical protein